MFFQETKNLQLADIDVPAIFFEQILPVIDGKFAKIYLYAYYLLVSSKENEMMDNHTRLYQPTLLHVLLSLILLLFL